MLLELKSKTKGCGLWQKDEIANFYRMIGEGLTNKVTVKPCRWAREQEQNLRLKPVSSVQKARKSNAAKRE